MGTDRLKDEASGGPGLGSGFSTAAKMVLYGAVAAIVGAVIGDMQAVGWAISGLGGMVLFAGLIGIAVNGR